MVSRTTIHYIPCDPHHVEQFDGLRMVSPVRMRHCQHPSHRLEPIWPCPCLLQQTYRCLGWSEVSINALYEVVAGSCLMLLCCRPSSLHPRPTTLCRQDRVSGCLRVRNDCLSISDNSPGSESSVLEQSGTAEGRPCRTTMGRPVDHHPRQKWLGVSIWTSRK